MTIFVLRRLLAVKSIYTHLLLCVTVCLLSSRFLAKFTFAFFGFCTFRGYQHLPTVFFIDTVCKYNLSNSYCLIKKSFGL